MATKVGSGLFQVDVHQDQHINYNTVVEDLFLAKDRLKMEKIQNAVYENDKVKEHVLKLRTGEDAIKFFAKYGNSTPIKFLNCYQDNSKRKRPYDLLIEHDIQNINKHGTHYYTVSPTGIVRVYNPRPLNMIMPGEEASNEEDTTEYISLSDWMKESTQFNIVSNIHYFKNFALIKLFTFWRSNVKYKKYTKIRESLVKKVFFCKPVFVDKLMKINDCLQKVHTLDLVSFSAYVNKQAAPEMFTNEQRGHLQKAVTEFNKIYEEIGNIIDETVKKLRDNKNEKLTNELEKINFGKQIKQKAIYLQKLEKQVKRLRDKLAKQDYGMRREFIRLVNYMGVENLVKVMNHCLKKVNDEVANSDRGGLFITMARFETGNTPQSQLPVNPMTGKPDPGAELVVDLTVKNTDIIVIFDKIIKDIIESLRETQKETQKKLAAAHFDNYKNEATGRPLQAGPEVQDIIQESVIYKEVKANVNNTINQYYDDIYRWANTKYSSSKKIQEFSGKFEPNVWKGVDHPLKEIESKINDYKIYRSIKDKDIIDQGKGVFSIDSKSMKKDLTVFIDTCLDTFFKKLKDFYQTRADSLLKDLDNLNNNLLNPNGPPNGPNDLTKLEQYAEFIKNYEMALTRVNELDEQKKDVEQALKILTNNKQRLEASDSGKKDTIISEFNRFSKTMLEAASQAINKGKEEMSNKLDEKREANAKRIEETTKELRSDALIDFPLNKDKSNIDQEISTAIESLDRIKSSIDHIQRKTDQLDEISKRMKREKKESVNHPLRQLYDRFNERDALWRALKSYEENKSKWEYGEFLKLDAEDIEKTFKQYEAQIANSETRMHLLVAQKGAVDPILSEFKNRLGFMKSRMPIIISLGNKNLNESHWKQIFEKLREPQDPAPYKSKTFTLQNLMQDDIMSIRDFIEDISARASGEARIESDLNEIKRIWEETSFNVKPYNDSKEKFILTDVDQIYQMLDDHQAKIQSMLAQKFVVNIRDRVEEWENKLAQVQNTLDEWLDCQRQWMYLENIFSAEDIQKELPSETIKFMGVDKSWRETMTKTNQKPNVVEGAANRDTYLKFVENNRILESVQKLLEDYLEKKRRLFPRFYFLTNDQLLEILSQTRNPHAVQPHLQKCFDNIKRIKFTEGQDSVDIYAMVSADPEADPETVKLSEMVKATGLVEGWLRKIEEAMVKSLYDNTKAALKDYPEKGARRGTWFFKFPAQAVLVVDMIMWTLLMEDAIVAQGNGQKDGLQSAVLTIKGLIQEMVDLVKTDLTIAERETIKSLIVLEVHNRDVTDKVYETAVDTVNNFEWAKQLRYYWETEDDDCFAKQTNTRFRYGYEYLGNGTRLVITPLTDKCYMTLTGALHLNYGGAPEGPAGTGKTETTKDLAKALAIQCIVFNCSGKLDYQTMGRFFSGLAQCGAWACFDEFNRIDIEVLSVIAQQILVIQNGVRLSRAEIEFEDKMISLNPRFGVFITMNPGYAGRTELPDNLKALFRPVAMMIPDYALIAEIILFSEGFGSAKALSRKMVYLYKLSSEQLSKQKHYDFGMRAVKSVLVMAGALRRQVPREEEESRDPIDLEAEVLLKAMRDSNVPKFLSQDLPLFSGIIQDLFPGRVVPLNPHLHVKEAIFKELDEKNLEKPDTFILKIIQLLETMIVRHGVMTVGETGTGKSTITNILAAALTELSKREDLKDPWYAKVKTYVLNPKSITEEELFGVNDIYTNTFTHGIVSKIITSAMEESNDIKKWVWFDGPVDAGWIENMNTVLDDNKMLCLPDGKRIKLPTSFTMLFEVQDLAVASPATVSRCGMVFLEKTNLGFVPIIKTWKNKFIRNEENEFLEKEKQKEVIKPTAGQKPAPVKKEEEKKGFTLPAYFEKIFDLINKTIETNLPKIRRLCKEEIVSVDSNLVSSCLSLFEVLFNDFKTIQHNKKDKKRLTDTEMETFLTNLFVFCFYWSVGGNLEDSNFRSREIFNKEMREFFNPLVPNLPKTDLYNMYIDLDSRKWEEWKKQVTPFNYVENMPYFRILVETPDTVRFKYLLQVLNNATFNVLLMGNGGVGKSVIVKDYLYNLKKDFFLFATTTFSAQTSSSNVQNLFLDKLVQRGRNLGPPSGKKMIFHFDDINMPKQDLYGAQPPNELLRQIIDQGGFYDLKKHVFKQIKDCCIVASCSPPGGGRNPVTPRLFRHFHMLWMPDLSEASMEQIFKSILRGYFSLSPNTESFKQTADELVKASVEVYTTVRKQLLPTPSKCHYTFNLRDLSKVIQGILQMSLDKYNNASELIRLWVHEECRIFHDRLVNEKDRQVWFNILLERLAENTGKDMTEKEADNLIFSDIVDPSRQYCEVSDLSELLERARLFTAKYNQSSKRKLELVFFTDALKHLCRISRVLKQPRGNCLLIGVGGSGRQSLTRIAKSINDYEFFMIEISKNYKEAKWREDLAVLLKSAGKDNKKYVFLFSDTQIIYESFLEDINNILNTGEVPNLWKAEDYTEITQGLQQMAIQLKRETTNDALMELFVHNVRENLHIALTFSPVGDKLRERCRQFPSIIDCCTIDWFERWPDEALHSVAINQITKVNDKTLGAAAETLAKIAVTIHNDVIENANLFYEELKRRYYITPTSYLELLNSYLSMFVNETTMIPYTIKRYTGGLEKLRETNDQINGLKDKIIKFQPILEQKAKENLILSKDLEEQNKVAQEVEKTVTKEAEAAQITRNEVNEMKISCEEDLTQARPLMEKAQKAAADINPNDINELKASMRNPSEAMRGILTATAFVMDGVDSWEDARRVIGQTNFLRDLRELKPMVVPEKIWQKLRKNYLDQPIFSDFEGLEKKSKALPTLARWLYASESYFYALKSYLPKEEKLKQAEEKLAKVESELDAKNKHLNQIREKTAELSQKLQESVTQAENLKAEEDQAKKRLVRAEKLLTGLADESVRWRQTEQEKNEDLKNLVGDMLMTSAILSYLGPFTTPFRKKLITKWDGLIRSFKIPFRQNYNLQNTVDPITIREWQNMGLPADDLSIENGIIMTKCIRWPLMIDPQSQANRWIKNLRKDAGLNVIKLTNQNFVRTLQLAVQTGGSLLIENVEETLDPILEPVLLREITRDKNQSKIKIGDEMTYNNDFKLFITTKMPNPHYVPEITIKVTLINFTVTPAGLEDQLLIEVIKNERPELEEKRDGLIIQISDYNKQLLELQEKILRQINEITTNILDNEEIIITLEASKMTSMTISKGMKEAKETAETINTIREEYRPIAQRGSILYFVIANLALIDPMYQYSLEFFISLFKRRLQNSQKSENIRQRITTVLNDVTEAFYKNICRGLFEKHKLMYSFLIASNIAMAAEKISVKEWTFFSAGSYGELLEQKDRPDWVPENVWKLCKNLETLTYTLTQLTDSMINPQEEGIWKQIIESDDPLKIPLPPTIESGNSLTHFQRMLIYYTLSKEKLIILIKDFVKNSLGRQFVESPPFDLKASYEDSTCNTPIVFILSPGADPMSNLMSFADEKGMDGSRFRVLSLGQGQGQKAEELIKMGRINGDWICLQNCHLAATWMTDLERIQENQGDVLPDYRLWLTSMPSNKFPVSVLQSGIKITNEPPRGIKANIKRSYLETTEDWYSRTSKPEEFKRLFFSLSLFHAVVLERRKFGAIGWNIPYGWMNSDLETCRQQLKMYLEEQETVPYDTLSFLVAVINYGGRVTDNKDERLIRAILNLYFTPEVMEPGYKFSDSGIYHVPTDLGLSNVLEYIDTLPLDDDPEIFGLHSNANITYQINQVKEFIDTLILVQPRGGGRGKAGKLPDKLTNTIQTESASSLHIFRAQEIERFNKLLRIMKKSLEDIKNAIDGYAVMSQELENMFNSMLIKKVPANWEVHAYPSLKPLGSWFKDLLERIEFMRDWLIKDQMPSYWVSSFYFPQGFMTAVLQTYARKMKIPIDELVFQTKVLDTVADEITEVPEDGVNVHGMFLQGCGWDGERNSLEESERKKLFQLMPPVYILPVRLSTYDPSGTYPCPVYKTSLRRGELSTTGHSTNFVLFLDLPSKSSSDHWIRRGVALLLQIDD